MWFGCPAGSVLIMNALAFHSGILGLSPGIDMWDGMWSCGWRDWFFWIFWFLLTVRPQTHLSLCQRRLLILSYNMFFSCLKFKLVHLPMHVLVKVKRMEKYTWAVFVQNITQQMCSKNSQVTTVFYVVCSHKWSKHGQVKIPLVLIV